MTTFIKNLNNAKFLYPILINRTLLVEIRSNQMDSQYVQLTAKGAELIDTPVTPTDFIIEGEAVDLEEVFIKKVSLKQLISFGKIKIKGSYRDFLKLESIILLS